MYCSARRLFVLPLILLAACTRPPARSGPERIAILRFENMSADLSADWQGRALAVVLTQELGAIPALRLHSFDRAIGPQPIAAPGISAENTQALAAGATRIGYGEFTVRNGHLEARLTLEDAHTLKMDKVVECVVPAGDVIGAATALARQVTAHPEGYPTRSPDALMHYAKALESTDGPSTERELEQAIAADPDFPAPYSPLVQAKMQRQDRAAAESTLEKGIARTAIPEGDRARFEVELAQLRGDTPARIAALAKLARIEPKDALVWRALGDLLMSRHDYVQARQAYEKAAAITPDDAELFNLIGYAAAGSGDFEAGVTALKRYRALRPKEANPLDSLGDVYLGAGKFAEAESYYLEAQKTDRTFLNDGDIMKAAMARLLTGDIAAADKIAGQFLEARQKANDALLEYRRAQWDWVAGRRRQATREMEAFAGAAAANPALRDPASRAWSDLTVWYLMLGDRNAAAQAIQKSLPLATAATAGNVIVARFLTLPEASAPEWGARANQQFSAPGAAAIKNVALTYALLFGGHFAAAQTILEPMWQRGDSLADEGLPVILAWCYIETGKSKQAEPLLHNYPVPPNAGPGSYTGMYFPRLFYLRAKLEAPQQARTDYETFLRLSGPDPLIWGEEKKAQAALASR